MNLYQMMITMDPPIVDPHGDPSPPSPAPPWNLQVGAIGSGGAAQIWGKIGG